MIYSQEWKRRLLMADSQNRAEVLVAACQTYKRPEVKRALLRDNFSICDALQPWADDLREQFEQAGFVTDTRSKLSLPTTVYRGCWEDDDPKVGLSWSLDREVAQDAARRLFSLRARLVLGMYRPGLMGVVYEGIVTEAYGYLIGRGEQEVVAKTVNRARVIEAWGVRAERPIHAEA